MKKRLDFKDILLIIIICLIPIILSFIIFSDVKNGISYILSVIIYSLYGVFREVVDFYLENEERDLDTKLNTLIIELCIYAIAIILLTLLFNYTGIFDLIIMVLVSIIPFFIDNMTIYIIVEKR